MLFSLRPASSVTSRKVPSRWLPHHEVGRAIFGVVIRNGILVLLGALVIDVEAEIDIQPAVTVIVGDGRSGKGSLRGIGELKRIGLLLKPAAALVQEQEWAAGAHQHHVLATIIFEVGKERA